MKKQLIKKKKLNPKELAALKEIHKASDRALSMLVTDCETYATDNDINLIPLARIRKAKDIIILSMKAGSGLLSDEEIKKLKDDKL